MESEEYRDSNMAPVLIVILKKGGFRAIRCFEGVLEVFWRCFEGVLKLL